MLNQSNIDACVNINPLIEAIKMEAMTFGGDTYAFDMEWKIRHFIHIVLKHALVLEYQPNLRIDGEKSID